MKIKFIKCELADLDELLAIAKRTFIQAFEQDNNPDDFKTYIDETFEKSNFKQQLLNPESEFYFAFYNNDLVGYFKLNVEKAQTDIKSEDAIELERIYVKEEFQRQQIGKHMLQEATRLAFQKNKKYIWLGVWENNTDAIHFYEKHGFTKFDTHPYFIGKDEQTDWLMRYDLINFHKN